MGQSKVAWPVVSATSDNGYGCLPGKLSLMESTLQTEVIKTVF